MLIVVAEVQGKTQLEKLFSQSIFTTRLEELWNPVAQEAAASVPGSLMDHLQSAFSLLLEQSLGIQ